MMNKIVFGKIIILVLFFFSCSNQEKSIEQKIAEIKKNYNIQIVWKKGKVTFPDEWLKNGGTLTHRPTTQRQLEIFVPILYQELQKYPQTVFFKRISQINIVGELIVNSYEYNGTYNDSIVIINMSKRCRAGDNTNKVIHHEMSSIFYNKCFFPKEEWLKNVFPNGAYYAYSDSLWIETMKKGTDIGNEIDFKIGFISPYCGLSLEDDFNLYAETLFTEPELLDSLAQIYPPIKNKLKITKEFYKSISSEFVFE